MPRKKKTKISQTTSQKYIPGLPMTANNPTPSSSANSNKIQGSQECAKKERNDEVPCAIGADQATGRCMKTNDIVISAAQDWTYNGPTEEKHHFTFFAGNKSPFSQFHPARFELDGIDFVCAEQYMMYQKALTFGDSEIAEEILKVEEPRKHKALGRKVRNFDDDKWKSVSDDIVRRGNMAKFAQNLDLKRHMFSTEGTLLVEAAPWDRIWGIGLPADNPLAWNKETWTGQNKLGYALTHVRETLMNQEQH